MTTTGVKSTLKCSLQRLLHHINRILPDHCKFGIQNDVMNYFVHITSLSSSPSSSVLHEALFALNHSVEHYIVVWMELFDEDNDDSKRISITTTTASASLSSVMQTLSTCEAILDWCWERINCGKFINVPRVIRLVYAWHQALKAILVLIDTYQQICAGRGDDQNDVQLKQSKLLNSAIRDALKSLDSGLMIEPYIGRSESNNRLLAYIATELHSIANLDEEIEQIESIISRKSNSNSSKSSITIPFYKKSSNCQVPRFTVDEMDICRFQMEHFIPKIPTLITDGTSDWPCCTPASEHYWSLQYLIRKAGLRTVPIECGRKYTDYEWSQTLIRLVDFIREYVLLPPTSKGGEDGEAKIGYLAQHNLFDQIPELAEDFCIPDLCAVMMMEDEEDDSSSSLIPDINIWFGPPGTVSPLHYDDRDNLFVQIIGRKYFRLYSRDTPVEQIFPHQSTSMLHNTSQIDLENFDHHLGKYAAFDEIDTELCRECIIQPGEILYIPKGWWHFVKSLDVSLSLSFWF